MLFRGRLADNHHYIRPVGRFHLVGIGKRHEPGVETFYLRHLAPVLNNGLGKPHACAESVAPLRQTQGRPCESAKAEQRTKGGGTDKSSCRDVSDGNEHCGNSRGAGQYFCRNRGMEQIGSQAGDKLHCLGGVGLRKHV